MEKTLEDVKNLVRDKIRIAKEQKRDYESLSNGSSLWYAGQIRGFELLLEELEQ